MSLNNPIDSSLESITTTVGGGKDKRSSTVLKSKYNHKKSTARVTNDQIPKMFLNTEDKKFNELVSTGGAALTDRFRETRSSNWFDKKAES